jgi:hypothetical protein
MLANLKFYPNQAMLHGTPLSCVLVASTHFPSSIHFVRLHRPVPVAAFVNCTLLDHLSLTSSDSFLYINAMLFSPFSFLMTKKAARTPCRRIATNDVSAEIAQRVRRYRLSSYIHEIVGPPTVAQYRYWELSQPTASVFAGVPSSSICRLDESWSQQRTPATHALVETR